MSGTWNLNPWFAQVEQVPMVQIPIGSVGVVISFVGIYDMLRVETEPNGAFNATEYGTVKDAEQFKALYAYSPLHNVKAGQNYPSTLITTADHDDRVVPAHSFKYAATMQAKGGRQHPILIRIETSSGHGASNVTKQIESTADIYSFLLFEMGITPRVGTNY